MRGQDETHNVVNSVLIDGLGGKFKKKVIVIDIKRKRVEVEEKQEPNKGGDVSGNNVVVDGPKNGLEEGSGYQARLEQ